MTVSDWFICIKCYSITITTYFWLCTQNGLHGTHISSIKTAHVYVFI